MKPHWTKADRQRFADRNILRSWRIPKRTKPAPDPTEWDTDPDDDLDLEETP
jgi:hypothetical protein